MSIAKLKIQGSIALFETEDYVIEIVRDEHNIIVNVPDEGGYVKAKAEYIIPHLMSIIAELSS
ncbi:hypothetical protein PQZ64_gp76 [Klebsiella phage vB_KpnM_IME346]|uniref:Uncharacterized protein n=1 Tax=Klebsiella phage vB_KpnM_IME346 TaxID=2562174 RepID=A0A4D6DRN1_9CAUD|nr:hypothetical protein PQZ64_gp76 [Klebsiella phage vB_KpnM_IME346]QBZ68975.1 hypothetical protein [Klebsiella phage vB_KpnM_IME346]